MKQAILAGLVLGALVFAGTTAWAIPYKNPAHGLGNANTAGVLFETGSRDLTSGAINGTVGSDRQIIMGSYSFALSPQGQLELHLGFITAKFENADSADGTIYGAIYRHDLSAGNTRHGIFVAWHGADTSNDSSDTFIGEFDGGYAMSFVLSPTVNAYAGGVFSSLEGTVTIYPGGYAYDFEGDQPIGLFAGAEMNVSNSLSFGAELHVVHESAFGFYLQAKL